MSSMAIISIVHQHSVIVVSFIRIECLFAIHCLLFPLAGLVIEPSGMNLDPSQLGAARECIPKRSGLKVAIEPNFCMLCAGQTSGQHARRRTSRRRGGSASNCPNELVHGGHAACGRSGASGQNSRLVHVRRPDREYFAPGGRERR